MKASLRPDSKIYVAGHRGLVGRATVRALYEQGYRNLILRTHSELNLLDQGAVNLFFQEERPSHVVLAAAKVGGIHANDKFSADFLYENLTIATHAIYAALQSGTEKLLFLGSSCVYPKLAPQPIKEESLLTGPLEFTNEGYAIAKIAGLKLCEKIYHQYGRCFISAMPTNLYGPHDNFHPEYSHVIPGLMRRFHEAKIQDCPTVTLWGAGKAQREFLHVDDLASALVLLLTKYEEPRTINVGTGTDITILKLAELMRDTVGYSGELEFDPSQPDGTPKKLLDVSRIKSLGWTPNIDLADGLQATYQWAIDNKAFL